MADLSVPLTRSAGQAPISEAPCATAPAAAADVGPAPCDVLACADGYVCLSLPWLHAIIASRPTQFIIVESLHGCGGTGSAAPCGEEDFLRPPDPGLASPSGASVSASLSATAPDDDFASFAGFVPSFGDAVPLCHCLPPAAGFSLGCGPVRGLRPT